MSGRVTVPDRLQHQDKSIANVVRAAHFPGPDRSVFEPVGESEGNYFLRWRILLRIRRFFRPTLRRPFPRLRLPISGSNRSIAPPSRFSASKGFPLPYSSTPIPIFAICDSKLANIISETHTPGNRPRKSQWPERMQTLNRFLSGQQTTSAHVWRCNTNSSTRAPPARPEKASPSATRTSDSGTRTAGVLRNFH
jgi:hypothetical protein